jgi:hypothetical protein
MRIAFVTEMGFAGKIHTDHPNMRTEFAWMHALDADHHCIHQLDHVVGYDYVFVIFPKGRVYLDACGSRLSNEVNPISNLLASDLIEGLKKTNTKVFYMQEGPHWLYNDYEVVDQINFYNMLASCDGIFAHNEKDTHYYRGLYPNKPIHVMPTLLIEHAIANIKPQPEDKAIIGGNFARWYGGFESYIVARELNVPIWGQTSHATRQGEDQLIHQLPRVMWIDWMKQLSTFKYAVHLMPTVAAGTFSLNCAYFGIPCIGNRDVDTQALCHPSLAVDVSDVQQATELIRKLRDDKSFYEECSQQARHNYKTIYSVDLWKQKIFDTLKLI